MWATVFAQAPVAPTKLQVHLKVDPNVSRTLTEVPPDSLSQVLATLPMQCTYLIQLTDTMGADSIQVKFGTTDGGGELFETKVSIDGGGLSTGMTFLRNGKLVRLGLGNFVGVTSFFAEARLVNNQNQLSGAAKYARP